LTHATGTPNPRENNRLENKSARWLPIVNRQSTICNQLAIPRTGRRVRRSIGETKAFMTRIDQ
jgi:hypothetical protein